MNVVGNVAGAASTLASTTNTIVGGFVGVLAGISGSLGGVVDNLLLSVGDLSGSLNGIASGKGSGDLLILNSAVGQLQKTLNIMKNISGTSAAAALASLDIENIFSNLIDVVRSLKAVLSADGCNIISDILSQLPASLLALVDVVGNISGQTSDQVTAATDESLTVIAAIITYLTDSVTTVSASAVSSLTSTPDTTSQLVTESVLSVTIVFDLSLQITNIVVLLAYSTLNVFFVATTPTIETFVQTIDVAISTVTGVVADVDGIVEGGVDVSSKLIGQATVAVETLVIVTFDITESFEDVTGLTGGAIGTITGQLCVVTDLTASVDRVVSGLMGSLTDVINGVTGSLGSITATIGVIAESIGDITGGLGSGVNGGRSCGCH